MIVPCVLSQARRGAERQDGSTDADDGIMTLVERMLEEPAGLWHSKRVLMQTNDELAVVEDGSLQSIQNLNDAEGSDDMVGDVPHLCEVWRSAHPVAKRLALQRLPIAVLRQEHTTLDCMLPMLTAVLCFAGPPKGFICSQHARAPLHTTCPGSGAGRGVQQAPCES